MKNDKNQIGPDRENKDEDEVEETLHEENMRMLKDYARRERICLRLFSAITVAGGIAIGFGFAD